MRNYTITLQTDFRGELLCEDHYNRDGLAGSAMTDWECDKCKGQHMHGNTSTPKTCLGCAIQLGKCQRCNNKLGQMMTITPERK